MTQGHLIQWHKKVGDVVCTGDLLIDVETDKAVMEVEATQEGILDRILVPAVTESVPIGQVIGILRSPQESPGVGDAWEASILSESIAKKSPEKNDSLLIETGEMMPFLSSVQARKPISPLAKKIAQLHGIAIETLHGSGPRGRIVKKDVEEALTRTTPISAPKEPPSIENSITVLPLTPMRKGIAQRLSLSKQTIPHFYLSVDCDLDALLSLRTHMNGKEKIFSINDFMVRACAMALAHAPAMRTLWKETHLELYTDVNLAVAVSIPGGLITPILFQADQKPLRTLTQELSGLIQKARANQLHPMEYQGGIFTLSNLGMFGIDQFHPIINPPHSGILAIGALRPQAVVREGRVEVGHVLTVTLAADHRSVDGSDAAIFLQDFKRRIESPYSLLS